MLTDEIKSEIEDTIKNFSTFEECKKWFNTQTNSSLYDTTYLPIITTIIQQLFYLNYDLQPIGCDSNMKIIEGDLEELNYMLEILKNKIYGRQSNNNNCTTN